MMNRLNGDLPPSLRADRLPGVWVRVVVGKETRKNLVKAWRLTGEIATRARQWDDAEAALSRALGFADAIANPPQLWQTHAALGRLHSARGQKDAAARAYARARELVDRVRATLADPDLRRSLRDPIREA